MPVREIGSDFHFPFGMIMGPRRCTPNSLLGNPGSSLLLASGRDCLHWTIRALGLEDGEEVLLPAYVCDTIVSPFREHGLKVRFYRVTGDLQIDSGDLVAKLSPQTRVLLYIHYFGFPTELPPEVIGALSTNTTVIEDSSHSLLSQISSQPISRRITFASFRKLVPVPDGALISWEHPELPPPEELKVGFSPKHLCSISLRSTGGAMKALWLKNQHFGSKKIFRSLYSSSNALLDSYPKPVKMSALSKRLVQHVDIDQVANVRRQNFQLLQEGIPDSGHLRPLYSNLPESVCPLGFPVLASDRDGLARYLIEKDIYPPIHWKLPHDVDQEEFSEAWSVSNHILTIPTDQRYTIQDMGRIVNAISASRAVGEPCLVGA